MWEPVGIGFVSGLRSMLGPTLVSERVAQRQPRALKHSPLHFMADPKATTALKVLAAGELVADKLPGMPDRIAPLPLAGRAASGALAGATIHAARGRSPVTGAIMGGLAAVAGAYVGFALRMALIQRVGAPNSVAGMVEDAAALALTGTLIHHDGH